MKRFAITIKGTAPLLQARHPSPAEEKETLMRKGGAKAKMKELTDEEQFEIHSYRNKKGEFILPSEMIEASMTKAATNYKLEGKKTYKDLMKSGIIVDPIQIVHKKQDFQMDACWGRNKNTGGAVWVVRPRIDEWELSFEIQLLQDERVSEEVLKEILSYAGLYVGIGAWRPKYGRFEVTSWKEAK